MSVSGIWLGTSVCSSIMVYALTVQSLSFLLALDGPAMNSLDVEEVSPPEPGNGNTTVTVLSLCVGLQSHVLLNVYHL